MDLPASASAVNFSACLEPCRFVILMMALREALFLLATTRGTTGLDVLGKSVTPEIAQQAMRLQPLR